MLGALGACALIAGVSAPNAFGAAQTIYSNNTGLPPNVVSWAFEATQTLELGDQVEFANTNRKRPDVIVSMSTWGCENGTWNAGNCGTTPGAKFNVPMRLNVYKVGPGNSVGRLIGAVTKTQSVPYRPSASLGRCTGPNLGKWYSSRDGNCYNGKVANVRFNLGDLELPEQAIISVEFNTTHYGYEPVGESAPCYTEPGGCGYDSLNVGLAPNPPTIGSNPAPLDGYLNSLTASNYCDEGAGGTGTFRFDPSDSECDYEDYHPALQVIARG